MCMGYLSSVGLIFRSGCAGYYWYDEIVLQIAVKEAEMDFISLVNAGATKVDQQTHLVDGGNVAVTIRIPSNLRDAVKEVASLRGMSFSAYVRMCMIDCIVDDVSHGNCVNQ